MITAFLSSKVSSTVSNERVCYPLWLQNKSGSPLNILAVDERAEPSLMCYLMKYFFIG